MNNVKIHAIWQCIAKCSSNFELYFNISPFLAKLKGANNMAIFLKENLASLSRDVLILRTAQRNQSRENGPCCLTSFRVLFADVSALLVLDRR